MDFADISAEFEVTNQAYFRELNQEYSENLDGENPDNIFGSLFMKAEIDQRIYEAQTAITGSTDNLGGIQPANYRCTGQKRTEQPQSHSNPPVRVYNVARLLGYTKKSSISLTSKSFQSSLPWWLIA